ncbi:MAG TPA: RNA polymerase sigma factor RpoD/SigA [Candidatus Hydrogenedentes bacterium]|nr:RNA polymerase sigma factor RpoD/SigA [Candidatus Hydrogenedentota bacterium]HQM51175.1 RNA polymerase sigma factor RpoD/SigA [Candidatus Hydrogenedentota bacterium]
METRPRTESIKKVFWELLGFDPVRDSLGPLFLGHSDVTDVEVFGALEDFPLVLVTFDGLSHWGPAQVHDAWMKVRKTWPSCLVLGTDSARADWVLAYQEPGKTKVILLPIFKDKDYSAQSLGRIAFALDLSTSANAIDIEKALAGALNWRRCDALVDQWVEEHSGPSQPALSLWMETMRAWPLFTEEQEREVFEKLAGLWPMDDRDGQLCPFGRARPYFEECVLRNLRLVAWLAHKYKWACQSANQLLDTLQEGTIGLMRAVQRFDIARDVKFSTFAYYWTRQTITRYLHETFGTIRVPVHVHEQLTRMKRVERDLSQNGMPFPQMEDIANAMGMPLDRFRDLLSVPRYRLAFQDNCKVSSRTHPQVPDGAFGNTQSYIAMILVRATVDEALSALPPKEAEIIRLRFGLDGDAPKTLQEVGNLLGLTRERIRQVEKQALERLSKPPLKALLRPCCEEVLNFDSPFFAGLN